MLNRLYIVIGVLAILAIVAAFVVPGFIQWGEYRERMQQAATEAFGAPVEIGGEIEFSLLPQPQLKFGNVVVGDPEQPSLSVTGVEAQLSLVDFLRDRYLITQLILREPVFELAIGEDGTLQPGLQLAQQVTSAEVSVASARIVDGALHLSDARSGERHAITGIDGELRMEALRGPFAFQGEAAALDQSYAVRLATSLIDAEGRAQLSLFARAADGGHSLAAEGQLLAGAEPHFDGSLTFRRTPPAGQQDLDVGRGDLVLTGGLQLAVAGGTLSDFTLTPDENRTGTRFQGGVDVRFGAEPRFDAVVSGGVMVLPPRDATAESLVQPYELLRLLSELPVAPVPPLPGRIAVEVAELDLRAVALRDLTFTAEASASGWRIANLVATLPGSTTLKLAGELTRGGDRPSFAGDVSLRSERLDALAAIWRKAAESNPLFGVPGTVQAQIALVGETLSISDAALTIGGSSHSFDAEVGFASASRHLNFSAALGAMDAPQSGALLALMPDIGADAAFGLSFPKGHFSLTTAAASFDGLAISDLRASGSWEGGVLALDRVAAADLGGVRFDAALTAFGTLSKPELSGTASLTVDAAGAPALQRFYDAISAPEAVRDYLSGAFPADLALRLDAPSGDGGQALAVSGWLGGTEVTLDAQLGGGFIRALQNPLAVRLDLRGADPTAMTAQLGLGDVSLTPPGAPMHLVALIEGSLSNSLETTLRLEGGGDNLGFSGNVVVLGPDEVSGSGALKADLDDPAALAARLGVHGIHLPPLAGAATLEFTGADSIELLDLEATAGDGPVSGHLAFLRQGGTGSVSGALDLGSIDAGGLLGVLAGPAAQLTSDAGAWPDGPLSTGDAPRTTVGRVGIRAPEILVGDRPLLTDAQFELDWDATATRLRNLRGSVGTGTLTLELAVCCAGPLAEKQFTGRLALADVDSARLLPDQLAGAVSARIDAGARFQGTGDSVLAAVANLTGDGNYTLRSLRARAFNPLTFQQVAELDGILEMEPEALATLIEDRLDDAPFTAEEVRGSFSIAGGVVRSGNMVVPGEAAGLVGSASLQLADLALDGSFTMSPRGPLSPEALLDQTGAQVAAQIDGTLVAPQGRFDVAAMVDAIMVRAYEIEVARLEQLRAEDEARRRAAAAERARVAAEEAERRAAEDAAARQAEEEEAARRAAEEEAARRAAEDEAAVEPEPVDSPSFTTLPPLTLEQPGSQF